MTSVLKRMVSTYSHLSEELINIYLVSRQARTATLLEVDARKLSQHDLELLLNYVNLCKLAYVVENRDPQRILVFRPGTMDPEVVTSNDVDLGRALGFLCVGQRYYDETLDRIGGHIKVNGNINLYSEVCESSKSSIEEMEQHLQHIVQEFQKVLPVDWRVEYEVQSITSMLTRIEMLRQHNLAFLQEHREEYVNDLTNYWCVPGHAYSILQQDEYTEREWRLLTALWSDFIGPDKVGRDLQPHMTPPEFEAFIRQFEQVLFVPTREQLMATWSQQIQSLVNPRK